MRETLGTIAMRSAAESAHRNRSVNIDQNRIIRFVGYVAFLMPCILLAATVFLGYCNYQSISHYYYAPYFGSFFVGSLGFIAVVMLSYEGHSPFDRVIAIIGGICAAGVAIFPTSGAGCDYDGTQAARGFTTPNSGTVGDGPFNLNVNFIGTPEPFLSSQLLHQISASLLFAILAILCLWSFRGDNGSGVKRVGGKVVLGPKKQLRNEIYLVCGLGMVICMAIIMLLLRSGNPNIFWPEAIALALFGVSWAVKSKIFGTD